MTTDTIPEAREASKRFYESSPCITVPSLVDVVTEACLAYHKRKLEECGNALGIANQIVSNVLAFGGVGQVLPLIQEHTAKAVEEATKELRVQLQMRSSEKFMERQAKEELQKQCEALETALADWHKLADQRSEALVKAQQQCEESRQFVTYWRECFKQMAKERDDLRTRVNEVEVEVEKQIQAKLNQAVRAEKAEAEVAELKTKDPFDDKGRIAELNHQLTQLQQDVKPLVEALKTCSGGGSLFATEALETFLTAHPECKNSRASTKVGSQSAGRSPEGG